MAVNWLARLAAAAPAPVFTCIGPGIQAAVERLCLSPALDRVATPRAAAILLVAGEIPDHAQEALDRVHDQVPHPRQTFRWDGTGDPEPALRDLWRDLAAGGDTETDRRPDAPPNDWCGVGPHGQGGKGMMGGTPYGRPMAMTADDPRDGLALDAYTARLGPFVPMLPPGLVLEVTLQGDVIVSAEVRAAPFAQPDDASAPDFCAARMLRLVGLPRDADRVARGARLRAITALRAIPEGLGRHDGQDARGRLAGWLAGERGPEAAPALATLLPGLEWSEAMLVINSFSPATLAHVAISKEDA
ncbi:hypothetical protein LX81_03843 [Palleronia aestuarii]|uniref:Uncharacterized protein n=1 Tax=Palleronia aestuarii TaxID=568105 RepID=A0A2W7NF48_9RHOB|nr:hypothetical protein [Palleronia aestuarii]PZX11766.1 hypothetical protein LX81_03843 [Palleronia aestuarii]